MAAMAAIRYPPAIAAVGGTLPSRSSGPGHEIAPAAAMSGSLTRHLKPGLQLKYSRSSGSIASFKFAGQENRKVLGLDVHAKATLSEVEPEVVQEEFEAGHEMPGGSSGFYEKAFLAAVVALVPLVDVEGAFAVQREFGLLEGKTISLIHPIVMGSLLIFTLYAGFLGWQWRRVRTLQNEISELKKQAKPVAVAAGERSGPPPPPSPVETQINALTEERKELVKGGYKDRHFNAGSILLGLGVTSSIGGALNTWLRTGKLFPGPHLFAGAGITICWALAAALVPAMQKGSDTARNLHIGLNVLNVGLFIWQIPTGWEIVEKVLQFAAWP